MKYILLPLLLLMVIFSAFIPVNERQVKGVVSDQAGKLLQGVTVKVKGTNTATLTNNKGEFAIPVAGNSTTLEFLLVGFDPQEIMVGARSFLSIILKQSSMTLDEVVVVGYGTRMRKDITGSMAIVSSSPLQAPYAVSNSLAGKVSGGAVGKQRGHIRRNKSVSPAFDTEAYDYLPENSFLKASDNPLSTFSIDVDAASYSNVRRYISQGMLPPAGAVRVEEMINYFTYDYPQPSNEHPFSVNTELTSCPWNPQHKLALIGLQGKKISYDKLPASNLVFLIDVSGSMSSDNKLPLVKSSLHLLTDQLRPQDKVAIVVYAGNAGLVLPATGGDEKMKIKTAINSLEAGGSTAGGAGIQLAYKIAKENFAKQGNNRVILCTDGDFNVGASSDASMVALIEKERESGVFLTVLGYGMGNYKDSKMQQLADKGNGNHAYIDDISEAKKVLINEFGGTLFTIAKDVKLQIEFNPSHVQGYRLIGYENRVLAKEDFNNDKKDAGDMGSGHAVTALYEIIPAGIPAFELDSVDKLRYQPTKKQTTATTFNGELMNIKLRYKQPDGVTSRLLEKNVQNSAVPFWKTSDNIRFAAAVASFGMQLTQSKYRGISSYKEIMEIAEKAKGADEHQYRAQFLQMVKEAERIDNRLSTQKGNDLPFLSRVH